MPTPTILGSRVGRQFVARGASRALPRINCLAHHHVAQASICERGIAQGGRGLTTSDKAQTVRL